MSASSPFHRSVAVVIGIDAYQNGVPPLRTAAGDARRLGHLLGEDHGYEVRPLLDEAASGAAILAALADLGRTLGPDDRVVFYFAGHGVALDGDDGPTGYLLPQDAVRGHAATYLHMPAVNDALEALPCRHLLVVLDSCFSGAFRWSSTRDLVGLPEVIHQERYDRFILDPAWQAIASANHDQTALDALPGTFGDRGDVGGHSPFAKALFDALGGAGDVVPAGGGDGVITASELYLYLEQAVQPATIDAGHRQTPRLWPLAKHDKGEFIFLVPGHELNLPPAPPLTYENNPWRGLASYEEADADLFFGRDAVVDALRTHVDGRALTAVLGASGTGKSSVVKAGLVPRLKADGWRVLPTLRPGTDPLAAVERAVAGLAAEGSAEDRVAAWCGAHPGARLALVVDQVEELVTMTRTAAERDATLALLRRLVEAHPDQLRVLLTLRSDFEPQFDRSALEPHWAEARYIVPPMTQGELREVIEKPASERVLYVTPRTLVDDLIDEVIQTPGGLPLLSFALSEMYVHYIDRQSDDRAIEAVDYQAVGGVVGALRTRAEAEVVALDGPGREAMRRLMLRMVAVEGGGVARRRVPHAELVYPDPAETDRVAGVVRRLTAARLVVEGRGDDGEPYVEPAHDALVRAWDRLLGWIHAEQDRVADLRFQHGMARATREWGRADPKARNGLLWRDAARGGVIDGLVAREDDALAPATLPAVARLRRGARSLRRRVTGTDADAEPRWMSRDELAFARRSIQRRIQVRLGLAALVAMIVAGGVVAVIQAGIARTERDVALSRYYVNQADDALDRDPLHALVYAIEAARVTDSVSTDLHAALFAAVDAPRVRWHVRAHDDFVVDLAVGASGERILTLGNDGRARVWDARTGEDLATFGSPSDYIQHAALSPDGRRLLAVLGDRRTGRADQLLAHTIGADDAPVRFETGAYGPADIAWSPDGGRILGRIEVEASEGGVRGVARLWDAATGAALFDTDGADVSAAAFAGGGRWIVTHTRDAGDGRGRLQVRSATDGRVLRTIGLPETDLFSADGGAGLTVSPDGDLVVTNGVDRSQVWDIATGALVQEVPHHPTSSGMPIATFGPSGRLLLEYPGVGSTAWARTGERFEPLNIGGEPRRGPGFSEHYALSAVDPTSDRVVTLDADGRARVWTPSDPNGAAIVLSVASQILLATFLPDGSVVTAAEGGEVRVWELTSGAEQARFDGGETYPELSPDGRFVTFRGDPTTRWSTASEERVPLDEPVAAGDVWSPDERLVLALEEGRGVRVLEAATGREVSSASAPGLRVVRATFSPDGTQALLLDEAAGALRLMDTQTGRLLPTVIPDVPAYALFEISPSGRHVLVGDGEETVRLVRLQTGETHEIVVGPHDGLPTFAFSPDGGSLMMALSDDGGDVRAPLWDVETGRQGEGIGRLPVYTQEILFSPDGARVMVVGLNRVARVWKTSDLAAPGTAYMGHARRSGEGESFISARFSPDSRLVLSTSSLDGTARVWDAATGREIAVVGASGERVFDAVFTPDSRGVVVAGQDGTARVYRVAVEDLLRRAEARLPATLTAEQRAAILAL